MSGKKITDVLSEEEIDERLRLNDIEYDRLDKLPGGWPMAENGFVMSPKIAKRKKACIDEYNRLVRMRPQNRLYKVREKARITEYLSKMPKAEKATEV